MLPAVIAYNASSNDEGYAKVAALLGESTANRAAHAVFELRREIGITQTLADFGVTEDRFDEIIDEAMQSGNVAVNPRFPSRDHMTGLLRHGMAGTI